MFIMLLKIQIQEHLKKLKKFLKKKELKQNLINNKNIISFIKAIFK